MVVHNTGKPLYHMIFYIFYLMKVSKCYANIIWTTNWIVLWQFEWKYCSKLAEFRSQKICCSNTHSPKNTNVRHSRMWQKWNFKKFFNYTNSLNWNYGCCQPINCNDVVIVLARFYILEWSGSPLLCPSTKGHH